MNKKYLFLASFLIVAVLGVSLVSAGIFDFLTGNAASDVSRDRGYDCRNEGCGIGEGDCRGKTNYCMAENSFCHKDIGEKYGFFRTVDVCECKDGFVPDGNGGCAVEESKEESTNYDFYSSGNPIILGLGSSDLDSEVEVGIFNKEGNYKIELLSGNRIDIPGFSSKIISVNISVNGESREVSPGDWNSVKGLTFKLVSIKSIGDNGIMVKISFLQEDYYSTGYRGLSSCALKEGDFVSLYSSMSDKPVLTLELSEAYDDPGSDYSLDIVRFGDLSNNLYYSVIFEREGHGTLMVNGQEYSIRLIKLEEEVGSSETVSISRGDGMECHIEQQEFLGVPESFGSGYACLDPLGYLYRSKSPCN